MVMTLMSNPKGAVGTVVVAQDGTGDTTDIQTGINMLPATGGCVYIKEGTYTLTQAIAINVDNTALVGCGRSTHIIQTAVTQIINAIGRNYIHIEKLFLDGSTGTAGNGIFLSTTIGSRIINCWIEDCGSGGLHGIQIGTTATSCLIKGNVITGIVGGSGISLTGSNGTTISSNFITDIASRGIIVQTASTNNIISGNYIADADDNGVLILASNNNIIDGNVVYHNYSSGILLNGSQENIISNNICLDNSQGIANNWDGIRLSTSGVHCLRNVISDNECIGNGTNQRYGIAEMDANQDYNTITGNVCYNNATAEILISGVHTAHGRNIPSEIHYWSCPGTAFDAENNTEAFTKTGGRFQVEADGSICWASFSLPNGAIITGAIVYGNISDETWTIRRITMSSAASVVVATANINTEDTSIDNATVDNSLYAYYFFTGSLDTGDRIYGARVTYTFIGDPC